MEGHPRHYTMCSRSLSLPLDTNTATPQVMTTKNVSRHCQVCPLGPSSHPRPAQNKWINIHENTRKVSGYSHKLQHWTSFGRFPKPPLCGGSFINWKLSLLWKDWLGREDPTVITASPEVGNTGGRVLEPFLGFIKGFLSSNYFYKLTVNIYPLLRKNAILMMFSISHLDNKTFYFMH